MSDWKDFHSKLEAKFINNYHKKIDKIKCPKAREDADSALDVIKAIYSFRKYSNAEQAKEVLGVSDKDRPFLDKLWKDFSNMDGEDINFLFNGMVQDIDKAIGDL